MTENPTVRTIVSVLFRYDKRFKELCEATITGSDPIFKLWESSTNLIHYLQSQQQDILIKSIFDMVTLAEHETRELIYLIDATINLSRIDPQSTITKLDRRSYIIKMARFLAMVGDIRSFPIYAPDDVSRLLNCTHEEALRRITIMDMCGINKSANYFIFLEKMNAILLNIEVCAVYDDGAQSEFYPLSKMDIYDIMSYI